MDKQQETFEDYLARQPIFHGADINHQRDSKRLTGQIRAIHELMIDGQWRTLGDIEAATGYPQASISAQLRNLKKVPFGGHGLNKRHLGNGLYEYQLVMPK